MIGDIIVVALKSDGLFVVFGCRFFCVFLLVRIAGLKLLENTIFDIKSSKNVYIAL